jgi:hypothetical protein
MKHQAVALDPKFAANTLRRTLAREELRLQVGTLRFDFATLAQQLDKAQRKEALKLNDAFYAKVRF